MLFFIWVGLIRLGDLNVVYKWIVSVVISEGVNEYEFIVIFFVWFFYVNLGCE